MEHEKVIVIGSINCDISFQVESFPAANETIMARNSMLSTGGKGLNQAVAAAKAGAQTAMIGCIGRDLFGEKALKYALDNGLDVFGVKKVDKAPTGTAGILVTQDGQNMIVISPGANACLSPEDIESAAASIDNAKILVAQMEIPAKTVKAALLQSAKIGIPSLFNPAPATSEAKSCIKYCDIISPNETETETLTGIYPKDENTAEAAAKCLQSLGAKDVIITLGAKGYYLFTNGKGTLTPAFKVNAIDPTGAGDVFNGVLAAMLARGQTLTDAAKYASAAAGLSTTKYGAENAAPTMDQIQQFLDAQV